jgi:hypothetical protein
MKENNAKRDVATTSVPQSPRFESLGLQTDYTERDFRGFTLPLQENARIIKKVSKSKPRNTLTPRPLY